MYIYLRDIGPLSSSWPSFPGSGPLDFMASRFCLLNPQLVILTTADDRLSISTCPPSLIQILWKGIMESTLWFDGFSLLHTQAATCWFWPLEMICPPEFDLDSLKRNDGANFNFILDCPPVWSCPKSVLGFRCLQEGVGYLQRWCFHVGFLEFQSHSKHKNYFDCPVGSCHTSVLGFEYL